MPMHLLIAAPVMLVCLVLQVVVVAICLRRYARYRRRWEVRESLWVDIALLTGVMLLTLLCNFAQIGIWAALFLMLGEFKTFMPALYHSGVNFATLGYGDIVMSERWRMLGPIEAANGILMFGMSTSLMTAAVLDVIKSNMARLSEESRT
ncbi:potassium channel family protein [Cupriavidus lacunae]|uniref:Two pore domain potassium channel family protein n=1 Tax=Cupriavidus lacunae TaxID=2666307 RepID=A0A370NPZ9_9BURK|nr:potassium channel family protein [Cupriavidus lacunae]RDK07651.1 two pore domain potassium channel family protein [Cupriavidus lacunae]